MATDINNTLQIRRAGWRWPIDRVVCRKGSDILDPKCSGFSDPLVAAASQTSGGTFEPWGSEGEAGALTERGSWDQQAGDKREKHTKQVTRKSEHVAVVWQLLKIYI